MENPFHLQGYHGSEYFCDRELETEKLIKKAKNGVNTTLISIRRVGKTGLIYHVFKNLYKQPWTCIYIDAFATQNLQQFINILATEVYRAMPMKKGITDTFLAIIKGFNPSLSFDQLTGLPDISLSFTQPKQLNLSIETIFTFLDSQNTKVLIAIDEFQQIANYPETNTEALLRTTIQKLKNVQFIFSGSHRHVLLEMFTNAKRPFFASTDTLYLDKIPNEKYREFINYHFEKNKRTIATEALDYILEWTRSHTYYTQVLCNRVFANNYKKIGLKEIQESCNEILKENEAVYFQYRNLLTKAQWNLLRILANEDETRQPTGQALSLKYGLGNSSSVLRSLKSLIEKEMVIELSDEKGTKYMVYDCFLSRWLQNMRF
jgi:uncharacterized protein